MPGSDRGAVSVEAALALCSLVLVTATAVGSVATVAASVRCVDASREFARLIARGEGERGRSIAEQLAPAGARIDVVVRGDEVEVAVEAAPLPVLPVRVAGRSVALLEPGAVAP